MIIAHRGASCAEPENTIAAFRRACELGADGVELDVRRTADDRLVVHHDALLADGRVIRRTASDQLPDHVPLLVDALDACEGMFVNVEVKNDESDPDFDPGEWVIRHVAMALTRRTGGPRWLVSSFRRETVDLCHRILPAVRTALLVERASSEVIGAAAEGGHVAVHPWVDRLEFDDVRAVHRAGLAVNTWTCDDPDRIRELIAWGVDGICTNVPDVALGIRAGVASG